MFKRLFHTLNSIVILHSFLFPTFQAMTSHVANDIYTVLCSSWHEDYVTFISPFVFLSLHFSLSTWDRFIFMSPSFSHIHVALLTLIGIQKLIYLLWREYLNLFLKPRQDLIPNLWRHLSLYPYLIAQLRGVNTQVSSDDPMGIVYKNTANDLYEIWRRPSQNTNCWNQKSLHSFHNRERLWTSDPHCVQQTTWATERLYDLVVFTD